MCRCRECCWEAWAAQLIRWGRRSSMAAVALTFCRSGSGWSRGMLLRWDHKTKPSSYHRPVRPQSWHRQVCVSSQRTFQWRQMGRWITAQYSFRKGKHGSVVSIFWLSRTRWVTPKIWLTTALSLPDLGAGRPDGANSSFDARSQGPARHPGRLARPPQIPRCGSELICRRRPGGRFLPRMAPIYLGDRPGLHDIGIRSLRANCE